MKSYGSFCPICGKRNEGLMLEETDGWMECIHCQQDVRLIDLTELPKHCPSGESRRSGSLPRWAD